MTKYVAEFQRVIDLPGGPESIGNGLRFSKRYPVFIGIAGDVPLVCKLPRRPVHKVIGPAEKLADLRDLQDGCWQKVGDVIRNPADPLGAGGAVRRYPGVVALIDTWLYQRNGGVEAVHVDHRIELVELILCMRVIEGPAIYRSDLKRNPKALAVKVLRACLALRSAIPKLLALTAIKRGRHADFVTQWYVDSATECAVIIVTHRGAQIGAELSAGRFGNEVQGTAGGVPAEERALWPFQDLDPRQIDHVDTGALTLAQIDAVNVLGHSGIE